MRLDLLLSAAAAAALFALSGCAAGPSASTAPSVASSISPQQAAALADGTVTWDEYEAGYNAFEACMADRGYPIVDKRRNGYLIEGGIPGAAVDAGVDAECYDYYWAQVDGKWQVAHDDVSYTARWLANCLRSKGITPKEKKADNADLLKANGIELTDCPTLEE